MLEQLSQLFEFLWGGPLFLCVIGIGFYFTVRLKFFQIINLKEIYRNTIGTLAGKNKQNTTGEAASKILKINRGGCHCAIRLIRRGNDRRCCCGYCGWRTWGNFLDVDHCGRGYDDQNG